MAKPSSISRAITSCFSPRGEALLLLLAVASIFSLLTSELSRRSALAAEFEGFDSDELEAEEDDDLSSQTLNPQFSPPTTLTRSTPESHHGPPSPISADPSSPIQSPSDPQSKPLDFWDEDEFEGIPIQSSIAAESPEPSKTTSTPSDSSIRSTPPAPLSIRSFAFEIACVSFIICFAINYFTGRRQNELIALAWASKFATKDTIFDKNFSLLGTGEGKEDEPLLLKEGQDVFKFYASGRRYCQYLLATMELKSRHDLIARIFGLVFPSKETIMFDVAMNDDAMDHVVLAVARRKTAKAMQKETRDLQRYAGLLTTPPAGRKWVAEELAVVAESKEVAGDLINDVVLDQVFGEKAFEKFGKWFISLHLSDQYPGSHKKILTFKFALPDANNMAEMTRLIALVPYYIDLIGRYKLSSQARLKTTASRAKAAQEAFKELQGVRQEEVQKRKAEKKLQEEAEANLSAEAVRRREEKDRARQVKKSMPRVKMLRSH